MNKNNIFAFFSWVILTTVISFLIFISFSLTKDNLNSSKILLPESIEENSIQGDSVLNINERYSKTLSGSSDDFLSLFESEKEDIFKSIEIWSDIYINNDTLDIYIPFLIRCNILSENMSDITKLKTEVWKNLDIFLINNLEWVYPDDLVEEYNSNFKNFSTVSDYTISDFFDVLNQSQWKFENTDNDFANNLANMYSQFYNDLQQDFLNNTKFNCEDFFKKNVFWLERS